MLGCVGMPAFSPWPDRAQQGHLLPPAKPATPLNEQEQQAARNQSAGGEWPGGLAKAQPVRFGAPPRGGPPGSAMHASAGSGRSPSPTFAASRLLCCLLEGSAGRPRLIQVSGPGGGGGLGQLWLGDSLCGRSVGLWEASASSTPSPTPLGSNMGPGREL